MYSRDLSRKVRSAMKTHAKNEMCIRDSQKAVENHVNGAVWAFDYDKMFCVLMENEICRKAVSYTHLDVYKRQALPIVQIPLDFQL